VLFRFQYVHFSDPASDSIPGPELQENKGTNGLGDGGGAGGGGGGGGELERKENTEVNLSCSLCDAA